MSILLMLTGIVREKEGYRGKRIEPDNPDNLEKHGPVYVPGTRIETNYLIDIPTLHDQVIGAT